MASDILEGKWKQMRGDVKTWWAELTDDEFDKIGGKKTSSSASYRKNTAGRKQRLKTRSTRSLPNTRRSTRWPDRYEKRLSPILISQG